jgi:hypothetical protein
MPCHTGLQGQAVTSLVLSLQHHLPCAQLSSRLVVVAVGKFRHTRTATSGALYQLEIPVAKLPLTYGLDFKDAVFNGQCIKCAEQGVQHVHNVFRLALLAE